MKTPNLSYRYLLLVSLPSIASTTAEFAAEFVDTAFAGRMDVSSLSALSACNTVFATSVWIFNFLLHVGNAQLASEKSSSNGLSAKQANGIKMGLVLGGLVGLFVAALLLLSKTLLLRDVLNLSDSPLRIADQYFSYRIPGILFTFLGLAGLGMMRGLQRLVLSFVLVSLQTSVNIAATYVCIYSFGMGLEGAAIGTSIAQILIACFLVGWFLAKMGPSRFKGWSSIPTDQIFDFGKNSIHQFLRTLCLSSTFFIAVILLGRTTDLDLATHQIGMQFWLLSAYLLDGIAITATSIGGKLLAENRFAAWIVLARRLQMIAFFIGCGFCGVYFIFPEVINILTTEKTVQLRIKAIWPIIAFLQIPNAIAFAQDGLTFGLKGFKQVRNAIAVGLFLFYLPAVVVGFAIQKTLIAIWLGNALMNVYRYISARRYIPKLLASRKSQHQNNALTKR